MASQAVRHQARDTKLEYRLLAVSLVPSWTRSKAEAQRVRGHAQSQRCLPGQAELPVVRRRFCREKKRQDTRAGPTVESARRIRDTEAELAIESRMQPVRFLGRM